MVLKHRKQASMNFTLLLDNPENTKKLSQPTSMYSYNNFIHFCNEIELNLKIWQQMFLLKP